MEEIVRHPVLLEEIFDPDKVERIKSDALRGAAPSLLETVLAGGSPDAVGDGEAELNQANVVKAKAEALGVLRRAGVDADNAAQLVGLEGVTFIPGQHITIRAPESGESSGGAE